MNAQKSSLVCFAYLRTRAPFIVTLHDTSIPQKDTVTYLVLTLDARLTWHRHIQNTVQKLRTRLYFFKTHVKFSLTFNTRQ
jgi:hypothetical protein